MVDFFSLIRGTHCVFAGLVTFRCKAVMSDAGQVFQWKRALKSANVVATNTKTAACETLCSDDFGALLKPISERIRLKAVLFLELNNYMISFKMNFLYRKNAALPVSCFSVVDTF